MVSGTLSLRTEQSSRVSYIEVLVRPYILLSGTLLTREAHSAGPETQGRKE